MYRLCGRFSALPWATPNGIWWPVLLEFMVLSPSDPARKSTRSLLQRRLVGIRVGRQRFRATGVVRGPGHHLVDESVLQCFLGGEPAVAILVDLDALDRLA